MCARKKKGTNLLSTLEGPALAESPAWVSVPHCMTPSLRGLKARGGTVREKEEERRESQVATTGVRVSRPSPNHNLFSQPAPNATARSNNAFTGV